MLEIKNANSESISMWKKRNLLIWESSYKFSKRKYQQRSVPILEIKSCIPGIPCSVVSEELNCYAEVFVWLVLVKS